MLSASIIDVADITADLARKLPLQRDAKRMYLPMTTVMALLG